MDKLRLQLAGQCRSHARRIAAAPIVELAIMIAERRGVPAGFGVAQKIEAFHVWFPDVRFP